MQTVIQVLCKGGPSLRKVIESEARLEDYGLRLVQKKRRRRPRGWAKAKSAYGMLGAINFDWSAASRTLTCRVVTRRRNPAFNIVGDWIAYLLARHSSRIVSVLISQVK